MHHKHQRLSGFSALSLRGMTGNRKRKPGHLLHLMQWHSGACWQLQCLRIWRSGSAAFGGDEGSMAECLAMPVSMREQETDELLGMRVRLPRSGGGGNLENGDLLRIYLYVGVGRHLTYM